MKIVAVTYGSRGDVQPILSLALALQSAGHSVHLVGPPENADLVQRCGCPFSGLGAKVDDFLSSCPNSACYPKISCFL
jgi:UDP:flavonoid glycosyltransferase YjiC (YdhE family)